MNKTEILNELKKQKPVLKERFNITKLAPNRVQQRSVPR